MSFRELKRIAKFICNDLLISVSILGERTLDTGVILVDDIVPNSMELRSAVVVLELEIVASFVTLGVLGGITIRAVKRLVDIAHEVDKEAESKGFTIIITVGVFLNGVNHNIAGDIFTGEPCLDGWESERDVLLVVSKVELAFCGPITDERKIVKVPVALPAATASL